MKAFSAVLLVLFMGVVIAAPAQQIYKRTNADGSVTYSDQPFPEAQPIKVAPVPATQFAEDVQRSTPTAATTTGDAAEAIAVSITSPENEAPIRANTGDVTVSWVTEPEELPEGYAAEVWLDNTSVWRGLNSRSTTLQNVERGEHQLLVRIYDEEGQEVARSSGVVVYVLRASILNRVGSGGGGR